MYHAIGQLLDQEACDLMVRVGIHKLGVPRNGVGPEGRVGYHSTDPDATLEAFQSTQDLLRRKPIVDGEWVTARLLTVFPSSLLNLHADRGVDHLTRYHVVIETNPDAWVYHGSQWQQLELGVLYRMDPQMQHASVNFGKTPRTHLFFDVFKVCEACDETHGHPTD